MQTGQQLPGDLGAAASFSWCRHDPADWATSSDAAPCALDVPQRGQPVADGPELSNACVIPEADPYAAVAERMESIFELTSPHAPGLRFVGGVTRPDRHVAGGASDRVSASGVGVTAVDAFKACMAEAAERVAQRAPAAGPIVQVDEAGLLLCGLTFEGQAPMAFGPSPAWLAAHNLTTGSATAAPAALCVRQGSGSGTAVTSHGCSAGRTANEAMLRGILECVERDSAALWWDGGRPARHVAAEILVSPRFSRLLQQADRRQSTRRSWLLDITGATGIPCVASISFDREGKTFAHGLAARLDLVEAAYAAFLEMCQTELAADLIAMKLRVGGPVRLAPAETAHMTRMAAVDPTMPALHPTLPPSAASKPWDSESEPEQLPGLIEQLSDQGHACVAVNLSRPEWPIPIFKMFVTGLQPMPSATVTPRLAAVRDQYGARAVPSGALF